MSTRNTQKIITRQGTSAGSLIYRDETLVFLVEAMAINTKTYPGIDSLYRTNEEAFAAYASSSALYNHPLITGGGLMHEIYGRKLLGIVLYALDTGSKEVTGQIDAIMQKGWPAVYSHIRSPKRSEVDKYLTELKNNLAENAAVVNAEIFIFYTLCLERCIRVVRPAEVMDFMRTVALRAYVHANEKHFDLYNKLGESVRKDVDDLESRIFSDYGIEITKDNQFNSSSRELVKLYRFYTRVAFTDKIVLYYLFRDVELSEREIKDILGTYVTEFGNGRDEDAAKLFLSGVIIKLLVKSVIRLKEYYSQHTTERKDRDVSKLENTVCRLTKENQQLSAESRLLKEEIGRLTEKLNSSGEETEKLHQDKIRELEKEIAKQNIAIQQEREKERELVALRDFFFGIESQEPERETDVVPAALMDLKDTSGAIIGGSLKWSARMKELLPKWVFISSHGFDKRSLEGVQTICFCPNHMSHSLYYKAVAIAKNKSMDIGFIYSRNEYLALQEIAKILAKSQG